MASGRTEGSSASLVIGLRNQNHRERPPHPRGTGQNPKDGPRLVQREAEGVKLRAPRRHC